MARPAQLTDDMEQAAIQLTKKAETARDLRLGLSVLLPKRCGMANAVTGQLLGIGVATVVRMQRQIRDQVSGSVKAKAKRKWGGRRRQLLTFEEEKAFLEPWVAKAVTGGVLVVPPIHVALEKLLGRKVPPSTVYRLLARHGWRKIEPDTCHPKRDAEAQEAFKKNSPKHWRKL
jgi:transposase